MCLVISEIIQHMHFALYDIFWHSLAIRRAWDPEHLPYLKWLEGPQVNWWNSLRYSQVYLHPQPRRPTLPPVLARSGPLAACGSPVFDSQHGQQGPSENRWDPSGSKSSAHTMTNSQKKGSLPSPCAWGVKQGWELDPAQCPLSQLAGPFGNWRAGSWGAGAGLFCCWPPPLPSSRSTGLKRPWETRRASSSSRWRRTAPVSSGL